MVFIDQINLSPVQMGLALALFAYIVWTGRPEWALGIHFSVALWTRSVMFGSVAVSYILLLVIALAALVYMHRQRGMTLLPSIMRPARQPWLPPTDRWILIWLALWLGWMLLLLGLYRPERGFGLLRILIFNILPGLPIVLLIASDLRRVRGFATAYLLATMVGGWFALAMLDIPLAYLLVDPTLSNTPVIRLNLTNYHFFAYSFSMALIMAVGLVLESKGWLRSLFFMACAAYCVYFLFLAGSRQSLNGAAVALAVMGFWALRRTGAMRARALLALVLMLVLGGALYQIAPELILRTEGGEHEISAVFALFEERGWIWQIAWRIFLTSPLWGVGFAFNAHNILVGILVDQGLVGMIFFLGFLAFALRQSWRVWFGDQSDPAAIWRVTFFAVLLFGLVHSQASGNVFTVWHLYWSTAFLWWLSYLADHEPAAERTVARVAPRGMLLARQLKGSLDGR